MSFLQWQKYGCQPKKAEIQADLLKLATSACTLLENPYHISDIYTNKDSKGDGSSSLNSEARLARFPLIL